MGLRLRLPTTIDGRLCDESEAGNSYIGSRHLDLLDGQLPVDNPSGADLSVQKALARQQLVEDLLLVMPLSWANRFTASSTCCSDSGKPGKRDSRRSGIARIIRPLWGSKRRLANSPSPSDSRSHGPATGSASHGCAGDSALGGGGATLPGRLA